MKKFIPAYRLNITLDEATAHRVEALVDRGNGSLAGMAVELIRDGLKQRALNTETTTITSTETKVLETK